MLTYTVPVFTHSSINLLVNISLESTARHCYRPWVGACHWNAMKTYLLGVYIPIRKTGKIFEIYIKQILIYTNKCVRAQQWEEGKMHIENDGSRWRTF